MGPIGNRPWIITIGDYSLFYKPRYNFAEFGRYMVKRRDLFFYIYFIPDKIFQRIGKFSSDFFKDWQNRRILGKRIFQRVNIFIKVIGQPRSEEHTSELQSH